MQRLEQARRPEQAWRLEPEWRLAQEWRVVRVWRPEQEESGSEPESGSAREGPMPALSAVAVCRGSRAAAEPAPFFVALVPARFPFPDPAAASQVQPAPLGQRAAQPLEEPVAWDVPEARQPALAGTVPPRAAEHEVSAPQAAEHAGQGEVAAVAPVAVGAAAEQRVVAERAAAEEVVARRREALGAPAELPSAAPWAAAWAFHRDRLPL